MPVITKIHTPARSPKRRAIHVDGKWALNCPAAVVEKLGLAVGRELPPAEIEKIKAMEERQKVMDKALAILSRRMHSRSELTAKLLRAEYAPAEVEAAVAGLERLGYVDDARFARAKASSSARNRHHGRRRAYVELIKAGVEKETARRASEEVFEAHDSMGVARRLAAKKAPSLKRLDPATARRRLMGMLLRRGFTFDEIGPVIGEVLGAGTEQAGYEDTGGDAAASGTDDGSDGPRSRHAHDRLAAGSKKRAVPGRSGLRAGPEAEPNAAGWRDAVLPPHARKREKTRSGWGRRSGKGRSS